MKSVLSILFIVMSSIMFAQNLVSNSSFSDSAACPYNLGQVNFATGWSQPTLATSDYFNACATIWYYVDVPSNFFGYQPSVSNSYTGLYSYLGNVFPANYREYISTTIDTLEVGVTYRVTIMVSLADSCRLASDGLGVHFSTSAVTSGDGFVLPVTPQIDYSSFGPITDKVNWVKLTKNFEADSPYTHLLVGCFKSDSTIDTTATSYFSSTYVQASYYYIDSVAVEKVIAGSDTLLTDVFAIAGGSGSIGISPNPFKDHATLYFENKLGREHTFELFDVNGRLVRTIDNVSAASIVVERGNLQNGFYYFRLFNPEKVVGCGKLVIE